MRNIKTADRGVDWNPGFAKRLVRLILAGALLGVMSCTTAEPVWKAGPSSTEPWWQNKPVSQMTPAEREEQDPQYWFFWGHLHGLGE
jgi:hypothetical protein